MNKGRKALVEKLARCQDNNESKLVDAIRTGIFPRTRLGLLAAQVYLQEKWPSHIARVYLKLDEPALADRELVGYIISIIRAENLGVGSRGIPHSDLAIRFGLSVRMSKKALLTAQPTVQNRALMDWCDMSALERSWLEGFAVHIACESQVKSMAKIARGLSMHYGVREKDNLFWRIHGGPLEMKHSQEGLALLAKHTSKANEEDVVYNYEMSCRLLSQLYDSILGD
jgi:pyrroloquinoline quinone (PQQ) biosynthesis protein C